MRLAYEDAKRLERPLYRPPLPPSVVWGLRPYPRYENPVLPAPYEDFAVDESEPWFVMPEEAPFFVTVGLGGYVLWTMLVLAALYLFVRKRLRLKQEKYARLEVLHQSELRYL